MVSSLPFLAPVFMKKARDYRCKRSAGYGSSHRMSRARRSADRYKLSDMSADKGAFAPAGGKSASEENILQADGTIVRSVTYSVRVDDDDDATPTRRRDDAQSHV